MLRVAKIRSLTNVLTKRLVLTDVSLLDSTPACSVDRFHSVIANHSPNYMDLGKNATMKNLWFTKGGSMYNYANHYLSQMGVSNPALYVSLPDPSASHSFPMVSYRTSISNRYQEKTENKSVIETKSELSLLANQRTKLYVSCINNCPIVGPIDIDYTLHELCRYYHNYSIDEITLCDTCGTLSLDDYVYLVEAMYLFGIPRSKIGLQLRYTHKNKENTKDIIQYACEYGFLNMDVIGDVFAKSGDIITYDLVYTWGQKYIKKIE